MPDNKGKITTTMLGLIEPLVKQEIGKVAAELHKQMTEEFNNRLIEKAREVVKNLSVQISENLGGMNVEIVVTAK